MSSETFQRWDIYSYAYGVDGPTVKEQPNGAWVKYEDIAQALRSSRSEAYREGMESAAKILDERAAKAITNRLERIIVNDAAAIRARAAQPNPKEPEHE